MDIKLKFKNHLEINSNLYKKLLTIPFKCAYLESTAIFN
jgi:hypothetical protein